MQGETPVESCAYKCNERGLHFIIFSGFCLTPDFDDFADYADLITLDLK